MNISNNTVQASHNQQFHSRYLQRAQIETVEQTSPHTSLAAKKSLSSATVDAVQIENLAVVVGYKQQQALLETAKKAFSQDESEPSTDLITGEIAMNAAKKQQRQVLIFTAIESINERVSERPRIQTQA